VKISTMSRNRDDRSSPDGRLLAGPQLCPQLPCLIPGRLQVDITRGGGDWPSCGRSSSHQETRFGALEVDELTVRRLHVLEHEGEHR
jgi:hypothetical protein